MTYDEHLSEMNRKASLARWSPENRRKAAMKKIEEAIIKARQDPRMEFTQADRIRVYKLMGGRTKKKG